MKSLRHYYIVFGAIYIGLTLFLSVLNMFLKLPMAGMSIVVPCLSAWLTAMRFVKLERRAPNEAEHKALTFGSFGIFLLLNVILTVGAVLVLGSQGVSVSELSSLMGGGLALIIIAVVVLVMFLSIFFGIWWAYGRSIRKLAPKIIERD